MKRPFLCVYDYGQGGVWVVLLAESAEQIKERYPGLQVVEDTPTSMSAEERDDIAARRTIDIDDEADSFLAGLRNSRPEHPTTP